MTLCPTLPIVAACMAGSQLQCIQLLTSCNLFESAHHARRLLLLQVDPLYAGVFISSMAFPALASIFKEKIFAGGARMTSA